jgi:outer membrane immunogenic protein
MNPFAKTLLTATALLSMSVAAHAADMAPAYKAPVYTAPVQNWSGFYMGLNGGWGWGTGSQTAGIGAPDFLPPFSTLGGMPGTRIGVDIDGGIAGGHLGYNWQIGTWLLGLEASADWADIKGGTQATIAFPGFGTAIETYNTRVKWQATATPRVGFVWSNWLFYGKGGLAAGGVDASTSRLTGGGIGAAVSATQQRVGWTAGAGVEWAFTPNWIAGVEYDYVDFGTQNYAGVGVNNAGAFRFVSENVRTNYSEVLGRISYKFDWK